MTMMHRYNLTICYKLISLIFQPRTYTRFLLYKKSKELFTGKYAPPLLWVKRGITSYLYTHRQYVVMTVQAYAAHEAGGKLEPFEYELGSLKPDEVEIDVEYSGICHSDLSMLKNEWGFTRYPFVPGHEVIGRVSVIGNMVNHLSVGQYVGLGWRARVPSM